MEVLNVSHRPELPWKNTSGRVNNCVILEFLFVPLTFRTTTNSTTYLAVDCQSLFEIVDTGKRNFHYTSSGAQLDAVCG